MCSLVIANGGARSARGGESDWVRAMVLALTAWLLGGRPAACAAGEVLRWKFKPGEVLRYAIEQKMTTTVKGPDRESKSTRSQNRDLSWRVNSVTGGGEAEITLRVDRLRVRAEQPPLMPLEFDSQAPKTKAQDPFPELSRLLRAEVGAEFTFRIKPTGEIGAIRFSEQTLKALREAAPPGAPGGEASEKALTDLLLQSSPPAFPEGPLEPGTSWSGKPARFPDPLGTIVIDKRFTFQGPDPKTPRLMLIDVETKVALEPAAGANLRAEIRKQEGKGSMTFDVEAGHIVGARETQKIELAITLMDQRIDQTTETISTTTLMP